MTTVIPIGFADWSLEIAHAGTPRHSFITGGVDVGGSLDPAENAQAIFTVLTSAEMLTLWDNQVTLLNVTVRQGTDGSPLIGVSTGAAVQGNNTQEKLPPNCAILVNKRTASGGRKNRGRWFIPWFVGETFVDEVGVMTPATVAPLQTAMNNVLAGFSDPPLEHLVILHDDSSPVPHTPTPVTSLLVSTLIATQRRRLGR